jgi:hypothetical protein
MSRLLWLLIGVMFAIAGCKGKLPTGLTHSKRSNTSDVTSASPLVPGKPVHEFTGELVFGPEPLEGLRKDDLIVVTWHINYKKVPEFFYHFHLFPKVRYIQYVSETDYLSVKNQIEAFQARGQETEGLSVLKVQLSKSQYFWRTEFDCQFKIVQNGILKATANSTDLDDTISKVIAGKFDTAKQASDFTNSVLEGRIAERSWYQMVAPLDQGKISFTEFTDTYMKWLDSHWKPWDFGYYYLQWAGCRRWPEVSKAVSKLAHLNLAFYPAITDIDRHLTHPECRNRVLNEFDIALKDKSFRLHAGSCQQMVEIAIHLNRKDLAKALLKDMMLAPDLKPLYAKEIRDSFQQEYEDLMLKATH